MWFTRKRTQAVALGSGLALVMIAGQSQVRAEQEPPIMGETMTPIFGAVDKEFVVVDFAPGQVVLTELQKEKLRALVAARAEDEKQRAQVVVSAWSDKSLPADGAADQSMDDREIAQQRLEAIRNFLLTTNSTLVVDSHNMAKRAGIVGRIFNTQDAKLKDSVAGQPVADANIAKAAMVIKDNGGPSRAIVMLNVAH